MNAAASGSPERAPFFRRFLTVCRKMTDSAATLTLVTALAGAGQVWLAARVGLPTAAAPATAPVTVRVIALAPEVVVSALFVEDLRLIRWAPPGEHTREGPPTEYTDGVVAVHGPGVVTVNLR